uniref:Uncharacterized protein n=1 Tax=Panagrolaimus sp. PS1159 TaxID=55785 RepID=A0AC35FL25_9BILA
MVNFAYYSVILVITFGSLFAIGNAEINDSCKDKVHNLVESHSPKDIPYPAKIYNFTGTVYDTELNPTCSNKQPTILMPGWVKLLGGELHVERDFDIVKDGMLRMTVYGSNFDDALCLNGTSQYLALPNSFW